VLLIGGEADHAQIDTLAAAWRDRPVRLARDLPLPHLAALLARCRLYLGHDTGISHLAAAAGAPSLLLFGPTDPAIWAPANPLVNVLTAPGRDLTMLSTDTVQARVSALLG
jgi:heptosyltransferase-2